MRIWVRTEYCQGIFGLMWDGRRMNPGNRSTSSLGLRGSRMDRLWAPWRLSYVAAAKPPSDGGACFICQGLAEKNDRDNLVGWRGGKSVVVLNRFPYNNGHLLIAPNAHKGQLHELDTDE